MTKISNLDYAQKGEELLAKVRDGVYIPYVKGGRYAFWHGLSGIM